MYAFINMFDNILRSSALFNSQQLTKADIFLKRERERVDLKYKFFLEIRLTQQGYVEPQLLECPSPVDSRRSQNRGFQGDRLRICWSENNKMFFFNRDWKDQSLVEHYWDVELWFCNIFSILDVFQVNRYLLFRLCNAVSSLLIFVNWHKKVDATEGRWGKIV